MKHSIWVMVPVMVALCLISAGALMAPHHAQQDPAPYVHNVTSSMDMAYEDTGADAPAHHLREAGPTPG